MLAYRADEISNDLSQSGLGYLLNRVRFLWFDHITELLAPLELTATQWNIVVLLAEADNNTMTASKLAQILDYDPGAMARLLQRLEKKKIILRKPHANDRRATLLELTPLGQTLYPKTLPIIDSAHESLLNGFSQEEINQMKGFLTRILTNAGES